MKRVVSILLLCVLLCSLSACGKRIAEDAHTSLQCIRLEDNKVINISQEEEAFKTLIKELSGPFRNNKTECEGNNSHTYMISLFKGETPDQTFYIDEDNYICLNGTHYVSKEKAEAPFSAETVKQIFEKLLPENDVETIENKEEERTKKVKVLVKSPPKPISGTEECENKKEILKTDKYTYYTGHMKAEGKPSVVLWRENEAGAERIVSVSHPVYFKEKHEIHYLKGSFEASEEKFIYFSIENGISKQHELWAYDVTKEKTVLMYSAPCSNIVMLDVSKKNVKNYGFILQDRKLAAINLKTGTIDMTASAAMDSIFSEPLFTVSEESLRYATISAVSDGVIDLTVVDENTETKKKETEGFRLQLDNFNMKRK